MSMLKQQDNGADRQALETPPLWTDTEIAIPARRSGLRDYQIDDEAVLLDPKTQKMYLLNQTALVVFRRCDGRTTMNQVAELLAEDYHVAIEDALDHVEQLVALFAHSLLLDLGSES